MDSVGKFSMSNSKITKLSVPSSLKTIGTYAFHNLVELQTVNIPEGVETIRYYAFDSCKKLETITIPSTVTNIENGAFASCNSLIQINLKTNNFIYKEGMLLSKDGNRTIFVSKKLLENTDTLNIPEGIKSLTVSLESFTNIKNVNIPKSLTYIAEGYIPRYVENITIAEGNENFYVENKQLYTGTTLLKSYTGKEKVTVKEGTLTIGNSVFCGEVNAKEITLPASVENIHSYIMQMDNSKLQKLKIGKNASNISSQFNFKALNVQIELDTENKNYAIVNNVLYNYDKTKLICALYPITENLTIESTVKEISDYSFYGQEEIQGITLPNGIEKIGKDILLRCHKIKKLEIPSSIKEIDEEAFIQASNLDEIIIHKKEGSVSGSPWGATKGERAIKWVTD